MNIRSSEADLDTRYLEELQKQLVREIPSLDRLLVLIHQLCELKVNTREILPCNDCHNPQDCESCYRWNALLPALNQGKGRRENLTGLHVGTLQGKERIRRRDIFEQYELWKDDYTQAQWEVIEMYYNQGMSEQQISKILGKKRSAINGRLNRARNKTEERQKQLRRETREQMIKNKESEEI